MKFHIYFRQVRSYAGKFHVMADLYSVINQVKRTVCLDGGKVYNNLELARKYVDRFMVHTQAHQRKLERESTPTQLFVGYCTEITTDLNWIQ